MSHPIDDDTTPRADGSIDSGVRRSVSLPKPLPMHKRSRGLRHALAQVKSGYTHEKHSRKSGATVRKRPTPSMPKLPWND